MHWPSLSLSDVSGAVAPRLSVCPVATRKTKFTEGFYYKPRVDKSILRRFSGGIIATSACLAGRVQQCLLNRDYDGARREAVELEEIFGRGNFFLELQDQGLDEE